MAEEVLTSLIFPHRPYNRGRRHFVGSVQVSANNLAQVPDLGEVEQSLFDSLLMSLEYIGGVKFDTFRSQAFHVFQGLDRYLSGCFVGVSDYCGVIRILGNLGLAWECAVWSTRCGGDGSIVRLLDPGYELDLEFIVTGVHSVQHVCELEDHLHVLDWECLVGVRIGDLLPMVKRLSQQSIPRVALGYSHMGISLGPFRDTALPLHWCR
jgi:hypothetical protein